MEQIIKITTRHYLLMTIGWLSVILGVIGAFLPILPTTPFILFAAWCFARSSERFHKWITDNKYFGPIITEWENGNGISRKIRTRALLMMWFSLCFSMLVVRQWWAVLLLISIGFFATLYLFKQPSHD
jgi:uncharacterized membrane protein YbaN (DUF454 family)